MNILIIASWYPSPESPLNGVFFQERARALVRHGCEVNVVVADVRLRMGCKRGGITETCSHGVTEYRYLKRNLTPFWEEGIARQQVPMIREMYKRICAKSGKPDVIHLESAKSAMAAVALARSEGIPLTYTEHNSGILNCKPGSFRERLMKLAVDNAAHTFLISTAVKHKVNPPVDKCSFLPNAVDFSQFTIAEPREPFTFCALGSLREIKGYDILLHAFHQVRRNYPTSRLVIGGNGEEWENLHILCDELSLTPYVEFRGSVPLDGRNDFYHNASAFVCSSHTETFSIVTVEALACGIPVIATKCGGPEDIINATNGILVEKNDVSALAEGMIHVIENREAYSASGIREAAYSRYGEDPVVERQIASLRSLISA